jgi:SPP1 family predicted phage head-tail adaptor
MRLPVYVKEPVEVQDGLGQVQVGFDESHVLARVWGGWVTQREQERLRNNQVMAEAEAVLRIRYLDGLTTSMVLSINETDWEVIGIVDQDERHREMLVGCKKIV